jgi:pyruvate-formate lyase-activating enzyme
VNDAPDQIHDLALFVAELARLRASHAIEAPLEYQLLTFHQLAADKYEHLGRDYRARTLTPPSAETMANLNSLLTGVAGLRVHGAQPAERRAGTGSTSIDVH